MSEQSKIDKAIPVGLRLRFSENQKWEVLIAAESMYTGLLKMILTKYF